MIRSQNPAFTIQPTG